MSVDNQVIVYITCLFLHACYTCILTALQPDRIIRSFGSLLSGSKWVSPGHTYMPDPDQNNLVIR